MLIDKGLTVGQRFKKFRIEKGMSQNEVCEGICSYSVVSHLENDRSIPSAKIIGRLAERLGVSLREIMGETEKSMDVSFQLEVVRNYIAKQEYNHAMEIMIALNQREDLLDHQRTDLIVCHAEALIKTKRYTDAITLLLPFLEKQQIQQSVDDEMLCDLYNKLGNAHYWSNDFEKAYSAFEQGYRISLKFPEFGFIAARVTKNLGLTCHQLGLKEDSRLYLEKAHSFFERASDMNELANTLFYYALATGNGEYMIKARTLYEGLHQVRESLTAKQHYAFYVEAGRNYKRALKELETCTKEFEKLGDYSMAVYTLSRLVMVCVENNRFDETEQYLTLAENYKHQLIEEDSLQIADFHKAKAMYMMAMKNYEEAISNAMKSTEICVKMGLHVHSTDSLMIVAESYHKQGMNEDAYKVSKRINELFRQPLRGE